MSSVSDVPAMASEPLELAPYRSLSKSAVISLVVAFISLFSLLTPYMLILPLAGLLFGVVSVVNLRRYPSELAGWPVAWTGLTLSVLLLVGSIGLHTYIYLTEVPDGYQRIAFSMLEPDRESRQVIPPEAEQLDGQRVFIKGYVHPGVASQGDIAEFILVPDMGTCCFGGQPKLTDMISVRLKPPLRTRYSQRIRRLAGTLKVSREVKQVAGGLQGGIYELEADYLK